MISSSRAISLANDWMKSQNNLPPYTYLKVRHYEPETSSRSVTILATVHFKATGETKAFALVHLTITNEEKVEVRVDRREYIEQMIRASAHEFIKRPSQNNYDSFDAFMAFSEAIDRRGDAPDWFEDILLHGDDAGRQGYDCRAYITTLTDRSAEVPVKIFASNFEKARYCRKKSTMHIQRMVSLVVAEAHSHEYVRSRFYHLLRQMREQRTYR